MAGLTEGCLRRSLYKMGSIGAVWTELVPVYPIINSKLKVGDFIRQNEVDYTIFQITGGDEEKILMAVEILVKNGIKMVDLNMGCPVPKITKGGGGAYLLKDPSKCGKIVEKLLKNFDIVVTAKIRSGWREKELNYLEVAKALEESGVSLITIHPRTREQLFRGKSNWEHIKIVKENLKIPVIGNGDIQNGLDAKMMFESTRCNGVMVGRSAIKNPFIFKQIEEFIKKGSVCEIGSKEKFDFLILHLKTLKEELPEKRSLHFMKVFVGKYTRGVLYSNKLRESLSKVKTSEELIKNVEEFYCFQN